MHLTSAYRHLISWMCSLSQQINSSKLSALAFIISTLLLASADANSYAIFYSRAPQRLGLATISLPKLVAFPALECLLEHGSITLDKALASISNHPDFLEDSLGLVHRAAIAFRLLVVGIKSVVRCWLTGVVAPGQAFHGAGAVCLGDTSRRRAHMACSTSFQVYFGGT